MVVFNHKNPARKSGWLLHSKFRVPSSKFSPPQARTESECAW